MFEHQVFMSYWEAFTLPKYVKATYAMSFNNFAECYMGYSSDMIVSSPPPPCRRLQIPIFCSVRVFLR